MSHIISFHLTEPGEESEEHGHHGQDGRELCQDPAEQLHLGHHVVRVTDQQESPHV